MFDNLGEGSGMMANRYKPRFRNLHRPYFAGGQQVEVHLRWYPKANTVIRNVSAMDISDEVKTPIIGEAKFMRATYYFHLLSFLEEYPSTMNPSILTRLQQHA